MQATDLGADPGRDVAPAICDGQPTSSGAGGEQSTPSGAIAFLGPAACEGGFVIHDEETLTSTDDGDQIHVSLDAEACRPARMGWSTRSSARIS
jgi:hypothetical protein